MIAMTSRSMTAAGAALLLMVALAACGGSSKTSSNTTNASSSRLPRSAAEVPLASAKDLRAKPALGKFLACMRAHGVHNFPGPAELSAKQIRALGTKNSAFAKTSVRCYDFLLRTLPEAKLTRPDGSTIRSRPLQGALDRVHGTDSSSACVLEPPLRHDAVDIVNVFNSPPGATSQFGPVPPSAGFVGRRSGRGARQDRYVSRDGPVREQVVQMAGRIRGPIPTSS